MDSKTSSIINCLVQNVNLINDILGLENNKGQCLTLGNPQFPICDIYMASNIHLEDNFLQFQDKNEQVMMQLYQSEFNTNELFVNGDINISGNIKINNSNISESQWTNSGNNIYYDLGNVGIKNTNPSHSLDVLGNFRVLNLNSTPNTIDSILSTSIIDSSNIQLVARKGDSGGLNGNVMNQLSMINSNNNKTSSIKYYNNGSMSLTTNNDQQAVLIDSNQNIGIGNNFTINSINSRLSITPTIYENKISFYENLYDSSNIFGVGISSNGQLNYHVSSNSDSHVFYSEGKNGQNGNELFRISGNGNVYCASNEFYLGGININEYITEVSNVQWNLNPINDNLYYLNGNVGIGTSNPQATFEVNGNINCLENLNMNGTIIENVYNNSTALYVPNYSKVNFDNYKPYLLRTKYTGNNFYVPLSGISFIVGNTNLIIPSGNYTGTTLANTIQNLIQSVNINISFVFSNNRFSIYTPDNNAPGFYTTPEFENLTGLGSPYNFITFWGDTGITGSIVTNELYNFDLYNGTAKIYGTLGLGYDQNSDPDINNYKLDVLGNIKCSGNILCNTISSNIISANLISGILTTSLQPNITSVGNLLNLNVDGNIICNQNITSNIISSNLISGILTTSLQPNITSIGNLTSLTVLGNVGIGITTPNITLDVNGGIHSMYEQLNQIQYISSTININLQNSRIYYIYDVSGSDLTLTFNIQNTNLPVVNPSNKLTSLTILLNYSSLTTISLFNIIINGTTYPVNWSNNTITPPVNGINVDVFTILIPLGQINYNSSNVQRIFGFQSGFNL